MVHQTSCTLIEAAELMEHLQTSHAPIEKESHVLWFPKCIRRTIQQRYHQVNGFYSRQNKRQYLSAQLPKHLHHRMDSLIARDIAALIWKTKTIINLPEPVLFEIRNITELLAEKERPWSISIGHVIPRDAQFTSLGDACGIGGGAFCHELQYWFDVVWSDHTRQQFDSGKIHINILEFVVVLLQCSRHYS
ncbi:hypothetical protein MHU86_16053 [Fragilaria crotonensis]|nr:hypothetical protein MHU86_16053 [Fragilaria crotonensis]